MLDVNTLVLGANGGTGVHVVERAVAAGDHVMALVRGTNVNVELTATAWTLSLEMPRALRTSPRPWPVPTW